MFLFCFLMVRRPPRSTRTAHSVPTRRSSDLVAVGTVPIQLYVTPDSRTLLVANQGTPKKPGKIVSLIDLESFKVAKTVETGARSEEHTSELQSLMRISYAVFCLKKKKTKRSITTQDSYDEPTDKLY